MSENASLEMTFVNRSAAPIAPLVEDHAAQLMDELFHDLDREFDPNEKASAAPQSRDHSLPVLQPRASLQVGTAYLDELDASLLVPYEDMDASLARFPSPPSLTSDSLEDSHSTGSRFLLCLAWGAFLGTAGIWGITQFSRPNPLPSVAQATVTPAIAASPSDLAFAAEFETLWQEAMTAPTPPQVPMAVLPVAAPPAPANVQPVATPLVIPAMPSPGKSPLPQTPPLKTEKVLGTTKPAQPTGKKTQAQSQPKSPQTVALANITRPPSIPGTLPAPSAIAVPQLPQLAPQTLTGINAATQARPLDRQAKAGVMVQGILDLGDKSAMLISRNGSTQNVHPGEVLDASGWVFMRVDQGKAIIQRGNEVRAVSGGESF